MDQIEAVAKVLVSCARLLRKLSTDGGSDLAGVLQAASMELDGTAGRLLEAVGRRELNPDEAPANPDVAP